MEQITLDMIPNSHTPIAHISQYDSGRHIRFNLQNITLTGSETVTLKIRKADGELVSKTIENHTNYVEYVSEKADCDVSGKANSEIVISKDDVVIGSKNFILNIEADPYDNAGVITKTASGRIATFETNLADVLQSLKCEINAKQDLHGYDHPWAGGAGKNKLDFNYPTTTRDGITITNNGDGTFTVNGTATAEVIFGVVANLNIDSNTCFLSGTPEGYNNALFMDCYGSGMPNKREYGNGVSFDFNGNEITVRIGIANGATISNAVFKPMIEQGTVKTAYEPYSNICPIIGHSELNLTRCGKNFFDVDNAEIGTAWNGSSNTARARLVIPCIPSTTYYISTSGTNNLDNWFVKTSSVVPASDAGTPISGNMSITTGASAKYIIFAFNKTDIAKSDIEALRAQLELGSTASEYEPYNGQTFTVAFGQTVYGGVYDKSGRLTIDTVKVVLDGTQPIGMANWNPNTNTRAWIYLLSTFPDLKEYEITDLNISSCKLKADKLKTVTYQQTNGIYSNDIPSISIVGGDYWSIAVRVDDTSLETDTAINNYLAQNPIEVVYELATPIVIDVQAISPSAVVGSNNVFGDTGDTEVKYLYIA